MSYHIENRSSSYTTGIVGGLTASPHLHPHLEMIYLEKGSSIAIADYQSFLMEEGDLFLSFPNQIHYYHDQAKVRGYMIIFAPDLFKELKDVFSGGKAVVRKLHYKGYRFATEKSSAEHKCRQNSNEQFLLQEQ